MLVDRADRIIAMGGYNTVCEVLSFQKRALIMPRTKPRREQAIRAERLRNLGLIDTIDAERLNAAELSSWLRRELPELKLDGLLKFDGLQRLPLMAKQVLGLSGSGPEPIPTRVTTPMAVSA